MEPGIDKTYHFGFSGLSEGIATKKGFFGHSRNITKNDIITLKNLVTAPLEKEQATIEKW